MVDSSSTTVPNGPGLYLPPTDLTPLAEDDAADAILQSLVVGITGLPGNMVRPRWQLVPAPQPEAEADWCAIGVVDITPEPGTTDTQHFPGADMNSGYSQTGEIDTLNVLCSFYGPHARGNALLLRNGLGVPQNREALYFSNMALVEIPGRLTFTPDIVNNRTVRRADLTINIRRSITRTWAIQNLLDSKGTITKQDGVVIPFDSANHT